MDVAERSVPDRTECNAPDHSDGSRRGFVAKALTALFAFSAAAQAQPLTTIRRRVRLSSPRSTGLRKLERLAESRFALYPIPGAPPTGYSLSFATFGVPGGFRTGDEELALLYTSLSGNPHVPLMYFATPKTDRALAGCKDAPAQPLSVDGLGVGSFVYYDGMWRADAQGDHIVASPTGRRQPFSWTREYLHSVVGLIGTYTVAIKAPVVANGGVPPSDLISMAGSIRA